MSPPIPRRQRRPLVPLLALCCSRSFAPLRTAPHRTAPHCSALLRTAPHRTALLRTAPLALRSLRSLRFSAPNPPFFQRFVTVPEVLQEIRDKHARRILDNLPFELELRTPSAEAMAAVRAFAEKTGDLRGLSLVDLRVLALAYMMEKEINGIKHLRTEPKKMGPRSLVPCSFFEQGRCRAGDKCPFLHAPPAAPRGQGPGATVDTVYGPGEVVEWRHGGIVVVEFAFGQGYLSSTAIVVAPPRQWGAGAVGEEKVGSVSDVWVGGSMGGGDEDPEEMFRREKEAEAAAAVEKARLVAAIVGGCPNLSNPHHECNEFCKSVLRGGGKDGMMGASSAVRFRDDEKEEEPQGAFEDLGADMFPDLSASAAGDESEQDSFRAMEFVGGRLQSTGKAYAVPEVPEGGSAGGGESKGGDGGASASAAGSATGAAAEAAAAEGSGWATVALDELTADHQYAAWGSESLRDSRPPQPLPGQVGLIQHGEGLGDGVEGLGDGDGDGEGTGVEGAGAEGTSFADQGKSRIISGGGGMVSSAFVDDDAEGWGNTVDDNEGQWMTPANVGALASSGGGWGHGSKVEAPSTRPTVKVGCITIDFAMQNVILGMGLHLLSTGGMVIRRLKQWVLKCDACFKITTDMTKQFCPVCGNHALAKLSVSVNDDGSKRYGYKKDRKVKTRGTIFPIAKNKGGRHNPTILLREDQLQSGVWAERARKKETVHSMFGEQATVGFNLKKLLGAVVVVGFGRKNPNEQRGRERRGKKKKGGGKKR